MTTPIASWKKIMMECLLPKLSENTIKKLEKALESNDPKLLQGATTSPPPLVCVQDWPMEAACLVGFSLAEEEGLETVGEVEEAFAQFCYEVDTTYGEPACCRYLLNWWDETPREEAFAQTLETIRDFVAN